MYAALWRALPGPWWLRTVILLVVAAIVVAALFEWVFPWIDRLIDTGNEGTIGT